MWLQNSQSRNSWLDWRGNGLPHPEQTSQPRHRGGGERQHEDRGSSAPGEAGTGGGRQGAGAAEAVGCSSPAMTRTLTLRLPL